MSEDSSVVVSDNLNAEGRRYRRQRCMRTCIDFLLTETGHRPAVDIDTMTWRYLFSVPFQNRFLMNPLAQSRKSCLPIGFESLQ